MLKKYITVFIVILLLSHGCSKKREKSYLEINDRTEGLHTTASQIEELLLNLKGEVKSITVTSYKYNSNMLTIGKKNKNWVKKSDSLQRFWSKLKIYFNKKGEIIEASIYDSEKPFDLDSYLFLEEKTVYKDFRNEIIFEQESYNSKDDHFKSYKYEYHDEFENLIVKTEIKNKDEDWVEIEHDLQMEEIDGNIVITENGNQSISKKTFYNNKLINEESHNKLNNNLIFKIHKQYDEDLLARKEVYRGENMKLSYLEEFGNNGNAIYQARYSYRGYDRTKNGMEKEEWRLYSKDGKLIELKTNDYKTKDSLIDKYYYNKENNKLDSIVRNKHVHVGMQGMPTDFKIIKRFIYNENGDIINEYTNPIYVDNFEYTYDEKENWIKRILSTKTGDFVEKGYVDIREIEYY